MSHPLSAVGRLQVKITDRNDRRRNVVNKLLFFLSLLSSEETLREEKCLSFRLESSHGSCN